MKNLFSVRGAGWGLCFALGLAAAAAQAATTINTPNQYAYGANIGWLDARGDVTRGAVIGQYFCTGYVWSANCGWICLGNGPTNGWNYSNASATDWGVNHDCAGYLWGYAYGANIGWVTFEQSWGRPRIDLITGNFSGYAWSANVGWIGFSNAQAFVQTDTIAPGPDSDADGIPDPWEYSKAGNLGTLSGGSHDQDADGVPDVEEYPADTDPTDGLERFEILSFTNTPMPTIRWSSRPTRFYRVEATNAMPVGVSGGWLDVGGGLLGPMASSPSERVMPYVPLTTRVYRMKAILPLSP